MGKITEPKEIPVIIIHESMEHGYAHCHVGQQEIKVYVFKEGIVPEKPLGTKDLKFIYAYYQEMIDKFDQMSWPVVSCPDEFKGSLYPHS